MLEIKPLTLNDLDDYFLMNSDYDTAYLQGYKPFKDKEEAKRQLLQIFKTKREYKIVKEDVFIGTISFIPLNVSHTISKKGVMIGYGLKKNYQNQGIMTRFLKEMIEFIFLTSHYDTIYVGTFIENKRSKHVIEKYFDYLKEETIFFDPINEYKKTYLYYLRRVDYLKLESENYLIRPFNLLDLDDYYHFSSDITTMNMAGEKANLSLEEARASLESIISKKTTFAIVRLDDNKVIGLFKEDDLGGAGFLGFALGKDYQNQGVMSEILKEFEEARKEIYACLVIGTFEENIACTSLVTKLGYHYLNDLEMEFKALNTNKVLKIYIKELIEL